MLGKVCCIARFLLRKQKLKLPHENGTEAPPRSSWQLKKGHSNHQDIISEIQTTTKRLEPVTPTIMEEVKLS